MRDIIENKEIKVNEKNIIPLAEVKEESDVTLNLELYKNNMPFDVTGQSIKLGLLINNELIGEQSDGITINKNVVTIKLKNSFIQPGRLELDLTLTDNTGRMTTSSFYLIVNKKTIGGTSIQGTDLLETLDQIILDFEVNFRETINGIKADYDSLRRIIISENQVAELQELINNNSSKIKVTTDEVIQARKGARTLSSRLDDIDWTDIQQNEKLDKVSGIANSNRKQILNCIKKDGSIPFETGQDKGVKIGEIARITVEGSNILIYNKSNGLHSIQLTNDGHFLLSEGGKIGSGNYPVSELWLGERSINENGYSKLPNGLIIQWGRGMVNESNSGVYHFPVSFPNDCFAIGLSGSRNSNRDYFLRMGRVSKSTYGQYSSSVEYNEVSWMAIGY